MIVQRPLKLFFQKEISRTSSGWDVGTRVWKGSGSCVGVRPVRNGVIIHDSQSVANLCLHGSVRRIPRLSACARWNVECDETWQIMGRCIFQVKFASQDIGRWLADSDSLREQEIIRVVINLDGLLRCSVGVGPS